MVADACLPSQRHHFIWFLFCYAKSPLLQVLELHAAYSSHHFLTWLHFQALEQLMPIFVVYEDKGSRRKKRKKGMQASMGTSVRKVWNIPEWPSVYPILLQQLTHCLSSGLKYH